jgi:hypothetical protein
MRFSASSVVHRAARLSAQLAVALVIGLGWGAVWPTPDANAADALADGPMADGQGQQRFSIRAEMTEMTVNSQGELTLIVAGANGWTVDPKFASEFWVMPEVGDEVLVARKSKYTRKDATVGEDKDLRLTVGLMAKKAGKHPVKLKASFQVCKKDSCSSQTAELRLKVTVKG